MWRSIRSILQGHAMAAFIVWLLLALLFGPVSVQAGPSGGEDSDIYGYVYDLNTGTYVPDLTIDVQGSFFLGNKSLTNASGYYEMALPSGAYVLRIYDTDGYIIYRLELNLSQNERKRLDFWLDTENSANTRIFGQLKNKFTFSPLTDANIVLNRITQVNGTNVSKTYRETTPDDRGKFEVYAPPGHYLMVIRSEGKSIYENEFSLEYGQEKNFSLVLERPSRVITFGNVLLLLKSEWLNILGIVLTIAIGTVLVVFVDRAFDKAIDSVKKKPRRFIDLPLVLFAEKVVKWILLILMALLIAYLVAQIFDLVSTLWDPIRASLISIVTIIVLIIVMRLVLLVWGRFINFLEGGHKQEKPKKTISKRYLSIIDLIGKYTITSLFVLAILLLALAALGMSDAIIGGLANWGIENASFIIFLFSLLVITYIVLKFITTFFEDVKTKSTRFSPEMIEVASKGTKIFTYMIIGLIGVFTVLSAAGLGQIGQTMILVFSMILGLVVSMAATGSIGNMLSGIVIFSFKPFSEGDWVIIANKFQGEVIETNLMFTKLKDMDDQLLEIPNNQVLGQSIVNLTSASKRGGFAIDVDATIGYDVPARQVMALMKGACIDIKGVLKHPKPYVVTTSFENHAIGYKLRAFIDTPHHRNRIRTDIMVRMQEVFTESGVEILSPIYKVIREEKVPSGVEVKARMERFNEFDTHKDSEP